MGSDRKVKYGRSERKANAFTNSQSLVLKARFYRPIFKFRQGLMNK